MLTKYQEYLYQLYKEIDEICERFDIEYCAAGGTMIGAIRHRGFIPWDDDMDIYMTLSNWRKFMKVCQQDGVLPEGRVLACQEFDRTYHNPIARYTDVNMTTIHRNQVLHDDEAGFVIDIFSLDPLPNDKEAAEQYNKDVLLFSDLINGSIVYSYRFRANKYRFFWYRAKMRLFGREKVLQEVENKLTQYDEDKCEFYAMRWGGVPLVFPKEMIGDCSVRYPYVDTYTRCPNKPFDYLVYHYGDEWMYVPPTAEQESHEAVAVFSTQVPYPRLRQEIFSFADKKKTRKKFRTRQKIAMLHEDSWNDLKDMNLALRKTASELQFFRDYGEYREEIEQCAESHNFARLSEIFAGFIAVQNDRKTIGRFDAAGAYRYYAPILVEIKLNYFELVLLTLFHTGRIAVAKRFIDVYEANKGAKTPFMEELNEDILTFRQAVSHFSLGEFAQAIPLIDGLIEKYPDSMGIINLQICRYTRIESIDDNRDKVRALAEHGLDLYPENKDFEKYIMDTEFAENKNEVLLKYVYCFRETLNGFMRLDIMDVVKENLDFYFDYCDKHIGEILEDSDDLDDEDDDAEQILEDTVTIGKPKRDKIRYVSIDLINRIRQIVPDNAGVYEKKFELLKKLADAETDPVLKADAQHRLIKYIKKIYKKYSEKFAENKYTDIEVVVDKWFSSTYLEVCGSEYVTAITTELYKASEFDEFVNILARLRDDMREIDSSTDEYIYCMELEGRLLYRIGKTEESQKRVLECIERSELPYLNRVLKGNLKREIINIYKKLYSSYNKDFIHKGLENRGLTAEEAYIKGINNKKNLIRFYKQGIDRIYPNVKKILGYLCKLNLLEQEDADKIIKKYRITEKSHFTLRIVTAICSNFDSVNLSFFDDDCIEEINDDAVEKAVQ